MWSALAIYALVSVIGEERDHKPKTVILAVVVPFLAVAHNAGGVLFAIAYSLSAVGPKAFDAARHITFSSERYPLLDQMRRLHRAAAERRALEAREYTFARLRAIVDSLGDTCGTFWGYVISMAYLTVLSRSPIYRPKDY